VTIGRTKKKNALRLSQKRDRLGGRVSREGSEWWRNREVRVAHAPVTKKEKVAGGKPQRGSERKGGKKEKTRPAPRSSWKMHGLKT